MGKYSEHAPAKKGSWPQGAIESMYEAARHAADRDSTGYRVQPKPTALQEDISKHGDMALKLPASGSVYYARASILSGH